MLRQVEDGGARLGRVDRDAAHGLVQLGSLGAGELLQGGERIRRSSQSRRFGRQRRLAQDRRQQREAGEQQRQQ